MATGRLGNRRSTRSTLLLHVSRFLFSQSTYVVWNDNDGRLNSQNNVLLALTSNLFGLMLALLFLFY